MLSQKANKIVYQPEVGVKQDFENLLQRFSDEGTVRYETFARIWRAMNMSLFCSGRNSQREAREFVEECFHLAVQFWLPPSSFLVRAGALYLLYGLFNYQLVIPKAQIRMTPDQWQTVLEFQNEAREQQHLDLDYVFQKMVLEKAFLFVATPRDLFPSARDQENTTFIPDTLKEDNSAVDEVFNSSTLNQLALVHDQYQKMKVALNTDDSNTPASSLNITHSDWIANIYKTLRSFKDRQAGIVHNKDLEEAVETQASDSKKHKLKHKAFEMKTSSYRGAYKKDAEEEDNETEATDSKAEMNSIDTNNKSYKRFGRGRHKAVELFTEDEKGNMVHEAAGHGMGYLAMPELPDYDQLQRRLNIANELAAKSTSEDSSEDVEKQRKGKSHVKGKTQKKGAKAGKKTIKTASSDTEETVEDSDVVAEMSDSDEDSDDEIFAQKDHSSKNIAADNSKNSKRKGKTGSGDSRKAKKVKTEMLSDEGEDHDSDSEAMGKADLRKQSKTKKASRKVATQRKTAKVAEDIDNNVEEPKGPTAQDRLHEKLKARKKQARMQTQGKGGKK